MNNVIEFADGSRFEGKIGYGVRDLAIYSSQETLSNQLLAFMNPAKTETITFYYGAYKDIYHGFTRFNYLEQLPDGRFLVNLSGDNTSIETKIPVVPEQYLPEE